MNLLKFLVHKFGRWYCRQICRREYESQEFKEINERPIEYCFIFKTLLSVRPVNVLDVGTGISPLPHLMWRCGFIVTAIDDFGSYWPQGLFNRHFYVIKDDISNTKLDKKFDFITCISILEHIENHENAVKCMFDLLNLNGHLILTFPYNEKKYIKNAYDLPGSSRHGESLSYICQIFSRNELNRWLQLNNGAIVEQEYWQVYSGEFWRLGEKLNPPRLVIKDERHHLTCLLIKKL